MQPKEIYFPTKPQLLNRPRINKLLLQAVHFPLVTLVAGPGYGKTVALQFFKTSIEYPFIYIPLSTLDNDQDCFMQSLAKAVGACFPALEEPILRLGFPSTPRQIMEYLDIFRADFSENRPIVVGIDNMENITNPEVNAFFLRILETSANQSGLRFFLVSSKKLLWHAEAKAIAQVETVNTRMYQVSAADLAFTPQEIADCFSLQGKALTEQQISDIWNLTEGWPMIVSMLCLHWVSNGIFSLTPAHTFSNKIFDNMYFSSYSTANQCLLVQLSLVPSCPPELIRSIDNHVSTNILELLATNPFVTYDYQQQVYVLHPLYRDFLSKKKYLLTKEEIRSTIDDAAQWFYQHGYYSEAQTLYMKADDLEGLLNTLFTVGPLNYSFSDSRDTLDYLSGLSWEKTSAIPLVELAMAIMQLNEMHINQSRALLKSLLARLGILEEPDERTRLLIGETHLVLAYISLIKQDMEGLPHLEAAATYLPLGSSIVTRETLCLHQNEAFSLPGTGPGLLEKAIDYIYRCAACWVPVGNGSGYAYELLFHAEAAFNTHRFLQAENLAQQAICKATAMAQHDIVVGAYGLLARIESHGGNYETVLDYLQTARGYVEQSGETRLLNMCDVTESSFYIMLGDLTRTPSWILSLRPGKNEVPLELGRNILVCVAHKLAAHQYPDAFSLLSRLEVVYEQKGLWCARLKSHLLKSVYLYRCESLELALEEFDLAAQMAHQNGITAPFVEFGQLLGPVYNAAQKQKGTEYAPGWLPDIIEKAAAFKVNVGRMALQHKPKNDKPRHSSILLTKRELAVLQQLAQGKSREQIAEEMDISINGVKKHLQNIYTKLGAKNRADAIHISMSQGII